MHLMQQVFTCSKVPCLVHVVYHGYSVSACRGLKAIPGLQKNLCKTLPKSCHELQGPFFPGDVCVHEGRKQAVNILL